MNDESYYVEDCENGTLKANGAGGSRTDRQPLVRTFNVMPERTQGADLRALESPLALSLSSKNGQQHDRVSLAASEIGVRRLTPIECERLQSLPDGWTAQGTDSKRYAALGDAVTANVAEWIGRRILAA